MGRAGAVRVVAEGASVLGVDVDGDRLRSTQASAGARLSVMQADLGDPETCRAAIDTCVAEFGGLDILGNVAGIFRAHHPVDVKPAEYHRIMAEKLDAYFFVSKADIPHLLQRRRKLGNESPQPRLQGRPAAIPQ